jgi:hypothetical protein
MLMGECDITMIFADLRLQGMMDGVDLAWEVKQRWPLLPIVLTSGCPREHVRKPWQSLNVLVLAEQAIAYGQGHLSPSLVGRV